MSFTATFSALVAIAKALPIVKSLYDDFCNAWVSHNVEVYRDQFNLRENKLAALHKAINNAESDADRIALSIVLHQINQED